MEVFYTKLISSRKVNLQKQNKSEIFFETKNLETLSIHAGTAPDPVTGAVFLLNQLLRVVTMQLLCIIYGKW